MQPTPQQSSILDAFTSSTSSFAIIARAGSGKTTTIALLANTFQHPSRLLCVAFNKSAAEQLREKVPAGVACKTLNALGFGFLTAANRKARYAVSANKYNRILSSNGRYAKAKFIEIRTLCDLLRQAQYVPPLARTYSKQHQCNWPAEEQAAELLVKAGYCPTTSLPHSLSEAERMLTIGIQLASSNSEIDFLDQLYLPWLFNLQAPQLYACAIVDEYQDLSALDIWLLRRCSQRHVLVGDPMQRIYEFRGAISDQLAYFPKIATTFPLSVSWRCPPEITAVASAYAADIVSGLLETAEGKAYKHPASNMPAIALASAKAALAASESCVVLSRKNAPLASFALVLHKAAIPFALNNPLLGEELVSLWEEIFPTAIVSREKRDDKICEHFDKLISTTNSSFLRDLLKDRRDLLLAFSDATDPPEQIRRIYSTDAPTGVLLSTVHRFKGREALHVICLDSLESLADRSPSLAYVAVTRSQKYFHSPLPTE